MEAIKYGDRKREGKMSNSQEIGLLLKAREIGCRMRGREDREAEIEKMRKQGSKGSRSRDGRD